MHFICLLIIICTLHAKFQKKKKEKKCIPAKLLLVQNWGKMTHLPQPTTGISLGNFIYTTIVCNDVMSTLHYHRLYQMSSLEANLSLEDMKQLLDKSHLHTGNIPTPKLIIKPDLF